MCRLRLFSVMLFLLTLSVRTVAQSPVFVSQSPIAGNSGSTFFLFLPVSNVGTAAATKMQLTSVSLTHLGSVIASVIQPSTFPFITGSGFLSPTGVRILDLEFDNSSLVSGNTYLLKINGTYQLNGKSFGFQLNRQVTYEKGFVASHKQVVDAIGAKFQSRPRLDRQVDNQMLLTFVSGLPQVSASGLQVEPPLVWMSFNDGGEDLVLLNNVKLPAKPVLKATGFKARLTVSTPVSETLKAELAAASSPTELPGSAQVRILDALGEGHASAASDLTDWLFLNGYTPISSDASIAGLRSVGGDGVFYISTHGGVWKRKNTFMIWSTTPVDTNCDPSDLNFGKVPCPDPKLPNDIKNGLVTDVTADDTWSDKLDDWTEATHYGALNQFISTYWGMFAKNAFVFFDACHSDESNSAILGLRSELFAKGASVYAGWTGTVSSSISADTADLIFDRLLGANQFCPEDGLPCHGGQAKPPVFAQRPFEYTHLGVEFSAHSLGTDFPATLQFETNPQGSEFGLLAPSISNMLVDETKGQGGELTINGTFGQDPRPDGSVKVGGIDAPIKSWNAGTIVVDLTLSGPGSAGDVQVTARQHKSNVARVTEWQSKDFIFTAKEGRLQAQTTYDLHFRADIRKYRPMIHVDPIEPSAGFIDVTDSSAKYKCSGTDSGTDSGDRVSFSLNGQGSMPTFLESLNGSNSFAFGGSFIKSHTKMSFDVAADAINGCICKTCYSVGSCHTNGYAIFGPSNEPPNFPRFTADLNESAVIQGTPKPIPLSVFAGCNDDLLSGQATFQWKEIAPMDKTEPDPKSAR